MYKGGSFDFTFKIKENYPHEPPKVRCTNKVRRARALGARARRGAA